MLTILDQSKGNANTEDFGGFSPYYFYHKGEILIARTYKEIYDSIDKEWYLDISAVLSLLNFNYIQGDRTLIQGVSRLPWHSQISVKNGLIRKKPIFHSYSISTPENIAERFITLLENELREKLSPYRNIYVLQTGGLDSRVTVAVLKKMLIEEKLQATIKLLTWGAANSRDVLYSKQIADMYDLEWLHLPFDRSIIKENIQIAVELGAAEVSAFHYHSMYTLKEFASKEDCVIASSYGDSIGRA